jgi:hypothetical protein
LAEGSKVSREEFQVVKVKPEEFLDAQQEAAKKQRRTIENLIEIEKPKLIKKEVHTLADEWENVRQELLRASLPKQYLPKPRDLDQKMESPEKPMHVSDEDKRYIDYQWKKVIPLVGKHNPGSIASNQMTNARLAVGQSDRLFFLNES